MAHTIGLVLDCANPTKLAEFWKLALKYEDRPPPPPFKTWEEWAQQFDLSDDDQDDGAYLHDPDGVSPNLFLQQTREPKPPGKNRWHLDIRVAGEGSPEERWARITAKAAELIAAGASVVRENHGHHVWMADPEGNDFCVA